MNNKKVKEITDEIFKKIIKAESIKDLKEIESDKRLKDFKMDTEKYPELNFNITKSDLKILLDKKILNNEYDFEKCDTYKIEDPLAKLLYSLAWKNGDLKKLKHIAIGITNASELDDDYEDAPVFYQFGKHLADKENQPIIDQHVIRAYAVYKAEDTDIEKYRKISTLTSRQHKDLIKKYIEWLKSDKINEKLKTNKEYLYYIDKILFATGKKIKLKNN